MLHSKIVASNLVKAVMIALIFFSCLPSSKADEVDTLIQKLEDKDYGVRYKATVALQNIKDPCAVEPLIAALKVEDLCDWHSNDITARALSKLEWIPKSDMDRIHFWVKLRNGEKLKKIGTLLKMSYLRM